MAGFQPQLAAAGLPQRAGTDGAHLAARLQQRRAKPHRGRAGSAAGARGNVGERQHAVARQHDGAYQRRQRRRRRHAAPARGAGPRAARLADCLRNVGEGRRALEWVGPPASVQKEVRRHDSGMIAVVVYISRSTL